MAETRETFRTDTKEGRIASELNTENLTLKAEVERLQAALILVAGECDQVHDDLLTSSEIDDAWERRLGGASQFAYEIAGIDTSMLTERSGIQHHAAALHAQMSPERAKPATHSNRTHEQCDECALVDVEPQACDGHPQGPTAYHQFTSEKGDMNSG